MLWSKYPNRYDASSKIESRIGYKFKNRELLYEALTHRSALSGVAGIDVTTLTRSAWNERLEFLGDSVLGLLISEALINSSERLTEGEMSRIRATIVCEDNLVKIGKYKLQLTDALVLGGSELASGGMGKAKIIADAVEALLGAIYQDGGWDAARAVGRRLFADELSGNLTRFLSSDSKTQLQELVQAQLKVTPTYDVISESGPAHKREFTVQVKLRDEVWGFGSGISKKDAAQAAAKVALGRMTEVSHD